MYVVGIDVGSSYSKAVVMDQDRNILSRAVVPLGTGTVGPRKVYEEALTKAGISAEDVKYTLATGYGRQTFDAADSQKSEISCHAKGAYFTNPRVRTIIDIGGQDLKAIRLNDDGAVMNFTMNDKCAAGTGRFLETMAKVLNLNTEDMGRVGELAEEEAEISNTCTVFAESEVISKLSQNVSIESLVAGIHRSVARRAASLAFRNRIADEVTVSGGVALNQGVVKALGEELERDVFVHPDCQYFGAIGAALYAVEEAER
ncbi:MAG: 2-hydroxyglutaryl-CoA dehydratase [Firmicutes bacterium]|nr:2-hydroxyglutaryl-CoA dehydratase [Bacillota bacterium]